MSIMKREPPVGPSLLFPRDPVTEESVWRRSVMLTMVREYDGQGAVLVQGDNALAPIRLRADGDSCELTMNFSVGGAKVAPMRVWIMTTRPPHLGNRPIRRRLRRLRRRLRGFWDRTTPRD